MFQETGVCSWKNKREFKRHRPRPEALAKILTPEQYRQYFPEPESG